ncbi:MAG: hypothetical protein ACT4NY_09280 [Pseudonocardiales bacterium]
MNGTSSYAALSSRLVYPEVRAALAGVHRNHDLDESGLASAEHAWEDYWAATRPVELTLTVECQAGELARSHALRGSVVGLDAKPIIDRRLAREFRHDRRGYVAAIVPFVWETIRRADSWAQATGWEPDPSPP